MLPLHLERARLVPLLALALAACEPRVLDLPGEEAEQDGDGDGVLVSEGDCDDADAAVSPNAAERCDGADNDCDGDVDEDAEDAPTWYGDGDADGWGGDVFVAICDAPDGFVADGGDCDDADAATHPDAEEPCTEDVDRDCDGSSAYADADDDGVPACQDCDDDDDDVTAFPGATETCDGADDDCDGDTDEDAVDATAWYTDADGDGYGLDPAAMTSCEAPAGMATVGGDCDDEDAAVSPGADEVCDAADTDEDCDGAANDADGSVTGASTWYIDYDGDGYGSATLAVTACEEPALYVSNADDCDDLDAAVSPAAAEVCDAADTDEDCDALSDDDDPSATGQTTFYADADGDGHGDAAAATVACTLPAGHAESADDCDDTTALAAPGLAEVCADGLDNDCAGDGGECAHEGTYDTTTYDVRLTGNHASEWFGSGLAVGDFDGDGSDDLAGGAPGQHAFGTTYTGGLAIWHGRSSPPAPPPGATRSTTT